MAIQFGNGVAQPVARNNPQQKLVAPRPLQQVLQHDALVGRIEALERTVAELRELIARQAVAKPIFDGPMGMLAPAKKSRAEYYREYRKRKAEQ